MSALAQPRLLGRTRGATPADVEAMASLINGYAALGLMLPKAPADLYRNFREYVVSTDDAGRVAACGGLRLYGPSRAEIVGLAVREGEQGRGLGGAMVERLLDDARAVGVPTVFAMTQREDFFHRLGFRTVPRAFFPQKIAADCRTCARRQSCPEAAVMRELNAREPLTAGVWAR